jgi:hypothetical protein
MGSLLITYLEIYERTTKPALTNSKDNEEPTSLKVDSETIKIEEKEQRPKQNNDTSTRRCSC